MIHKGMYATAHYFVRLIVTQVVEGNKNYGR